MKKFLLIISLFLFINFTFGQNAPLPPKPPTPDKTTKSSNSNSYRMYGKVEKTILPKFDIPLSESSNINSIYYFKTVENKIIKLDSTVTAEQIISLTKFNISKNKINPNYLDSLSNKAYKQNEEKKYLEAINTTTLILNHSPNNIAGHKEIAFAYKRIGKDSLSSLHLTMMTKIIKAVFKFSDGTYEYPFLVNNFFEGFSIYEAVFRCIPKKFTLMLDKKERILGAYNGYSSAFDEILIKYTELSHWKPKLKPDDYIVEK